jgi:hypothetical protein
VSASYLTPFGRQVQDAIETFRAARNRCNECLHTESVGCLKLRLICNRGTLIVPVCQACAERYRNAGLAGVPRIHASCWAAVTTGSGQA